MDARHECLPLTAIRGLAACWVVAHHVQPILFGGIPAPVAASLVLGHVSVDVFFVLSGFILGSLYGGLTTEGVPAFWMRRLCRVYPLHVAVMVALAVLAAATTLLHINRTDHDWAAFPVVLALLHPYVPGSASWNAPSWSVGIELACYALFPTAAALLRRLPVSGVVVLTLLLAVAETLVLRDWDGAVEGRGALLRGLTGFYLGMAMALLAPHLPRQWMPGLAWLAVAGIALGVAGADPAGVVLPAAGLIVALAAERGQVVRLLSAGWAVWLGRVSFSIYLLHAPLLTIVLRLPMPGGPVARTALLVAVLLPASAATHRWIEQPGRRLPGLLLRRQTVLV